MVSILQYTMRILLVYVAVYTDQHVIVFDSIELYIMVEVGNVMVCEGTRKYLDVYIRMYQKNISKKNNPNSPLIGLRIGLNDSKGFLISILFRESSVT